MDNRAVGSQVEGILPEGILPEGSHELVEVDIHKADHMPAGEGTQLEVEGVGRCETSAGQGAQTSLMVVQIFHLFCPFQFCVASACMHKHWRNSVSHRTTVLSPERFNHSTDSLTSSTPYLTNRTKSEMLVKSHRCRQSWQQWRICMPLVAGRT